MLCLVPDVDLSFSGVAQITAGQIPQYIIDNNYFEIQE